MDVKQKIIDAVKTAANSAISDGVLKTSENLPEISLEVPPKKEFGDFSTNFAMQSAKVFHTAPRKIAEEIKNRNCGRGLYEFLSEVRRNLRRTEKYF